MGSNLSGCYGSPAGALVAAVAAIDACDGVRVIAQSPVYKSAPVPISDQPWYHNSVIAVETLLEPLDLLKVLQGVEVRFGRERVDGERNAARTLDLDIIAYHDVVLGDVDLEIPHPRMADRAFVLLPLYDVEPKWKHPVSGLCIEEMVELLPEGQDIQRIGEE